MRIDRLKLFLDSMGGGAWPFLVGGVICLVNSVNERDLSLLIKYNLSFVTPAFAQAFGVLCPCGAGALPK